jgi:hypothetical protein
MKYSNHVMQAIRQHMSLDKDDTSEDRIIEQASLKSALDHYLSWEGIHGYTDTVLEIVRSNQIQYRPFNDNDYHAFADAAPFTPSHPPMIGSFELDGQRGDIVIDRLGVGLFWGEDAPDDINNASGGGWYCEHGGVAVLLKPQMTLAEIKALGFEPC